jgi:phosphate starvation-inducible PhoH-like protein
MGQTLEDRRRVTTHDTRTITLDDRDEALLLFGQRDTNLRMIRDALGVRLVARGDTVQVEGPAESVDQAERVFYQLRQLLKNSGQIQPEEVRSTLTAIQSSGAQPPAAVGLRDQTRGVRARTDGQARYLQAMRDNDVVMCIGPAGTGKTYLAVAHGVTLLRAGHVRRIVLVRPAVEAGERLGFLPGDMAAKINPYLRPLFDALNDLMEPEQVRRYLESDVIEIAPLAFMRGRTLNHAAIILDEGQNTTVPQMKMFLTRLGQNSKIVVTGDVTQTDLPDRTRSGLNDAVHRLKGIERVGVVYLDQSDIVRHPLVQRIVKAYDEPLPKRKF